MFICNISYNQPVLIYIFVNDTMNLISCNGKIIACARALCYLQIANEKRVE